MTTAPVVPLWGHQLTVTAPPGTLESFGPPTTVGKAGARGAPGTEMRVGAEDVKFTFDLTFGGRGLASHVATLFDEDMPDTTCVFCGNCVGVCPTGALKGKVEASLEQLQV